MDNLVNFGILEECSDDIISEDFCDNSRTKTIPLVENELGVALVSGFSQNVLKMVMTNNLNPYDILIEAITSPRYDAIKC